MNQRVVVLNGAKMNYDGKLDFSVLSPDTVVYDDSKEDEIVERVDGAAAVITKEMPVPAEIIQQFPDSVKLIVEAGTGYNNIDIQAAKDKGITVCNIPAYSTQRVAHTAVMLLLNLASSMRVQMAMLTKRGPAQFYRSSPGAPWRSEWESAGNHRSRPYWKGSHENRHRSRYGNRGVYAYAPP